MCDRCCQSCWSQHFYKQYLEQHSAMTQWLQQVNQQSYLPAANCPVTQHFNAYVHNQPQQVCQEPLQCSECRGLAPRVGNHQNQLSGKRTRDHLSRTDESLSEETDESSSEESDVSRDDIIGSDDEIVFDPGCLLELGKDKESLSEKSDSDDDEEEDDEEELKVAHSVKEEFEYVQLDKFGNMSENRKGRKGRPHAEKEMKIEKETREYLYGDKADTIAGLETAMSLDFNRLCDLYQPHLWPVLPVRLSKN